MAEADALTTIQKFVQKDPLLKQHVDQLVVRIDGSEHVFVP